LGRPRWATRREPRNYDNGPPVRRYEYARDWSEALPKPVEEVIEEVVSAEGVVEDSPIDELADSRPEATNGAESSNGENESIEFDDSDMDFADEFDNSDDLIEIDDEDPIGTVDRLVAAGVRGKHYPAEAPLSIAVYSHIVY
jgi:hypothetical protein